MFGLNAVDFSKAVSIIGTAAVHQCWTKKFCSNMPGYLVRHIQDKNIFLRFIATSAGMINLEFWAKILYPDLRENNDFWISIEENLNLASDRLIYLPYLTFGEERSEEKEWSLGGCFLGLNSGHTRENLMYAVYEGIALQTARIYDLLLDHNCLQQIEEIRFGGGGARSNLLASLIAQSTGVQVVCPHLDEIGLTGIAAVAWTALHPNSLLDYWTQNMLKSSKIKIFTPNAKNEERYKSLKEYVDNIVNDLSKVKINRMSSL
jgi:sugar (pentulose or hexulose) kinase